MINKLAKTLSKSDSSILNKQEVFNFNPQNNVILEKTTKNFLFSLLKSYFKKYFCFISKPIFTVTSEKIIIHLLYYKKPSALLHSPFNKKYASASTYASVHGGDEGNKKNRSPKIIRGPATLGERLAKSSNKHQISLRFSKSNNRRYTNIKRSTLLRRLFLLARKVVFNNSNESESTQTTVNNQGPLNTETDSGHWEGLTIDNLKSNIWKKVLMKQIKNLSSSTSKKKYDSRGDRPRVTVNSLIKGNISTLKLKEYTETIGPSALLLRTTGDGAVRGKGDPTIESILLNLVHKKKDNLNQLRRRKIKMNERAPAYARTRSSITSKFKSATKKGGRQSSIFRLHLNNLIELLSDILCTEVELEIVQLKYPYHDSNIFAQYLGLKARKLTYGKIKNKIIKRIPVALSNSKSKTNNKNSVWKGGKKMSILSAFKFGVGQGLGGLGLSAVSKGGVLKKKAKLLGLEGSPSSKKKLNNLGISILNLSKSNLVSISNGKNLLPSRTWEHERKVGKKGTINLINLNMQKSLRKARLKKLIVSRLTGIKVRIAGRLARQRVVPKRTVKTTYKGAISRSNNNLVDSATYTDKNKKGAFSIRVWLSHGIKK